MEKERLSTLKAAIEAQLGEIDRVYERIEKRRTGQGPAYIESLAYQRHAYTYELDPRKVRLVLEDALAVRKKILDDVHRFLQALDA